MTKYSTKNSKKRYPATPMNMQKKYLLTIIQILLFGI